MNPFHWEQKKSSGSFKNVIYKMCFSEEIYVKCCYVGYFLAECSVKIKERREDEDAVRFLYEGFNGSMK